MNDRFAFTASRLSDQELQNRIATREKYLPETTEASVAELQNRGHVFSDEELLVISQDITAQRENAAQSGRDGARLLNASYKANLVDDPDAPVLYSRRAVYVFTVLFGPFFGYIMLAIDAGKVKNGSGVGPSLLAGLALVVGQVIGAKYIGGAAFPVIWGVFSAIVIDNILWKRVIGDATFYKAKSLLVPSIIGGAILLLLVFSLVAKLNHA